MSTTSLALTTTRRWSPLVAGLTFLLGYLLVSPVSGALADGPMPLPDAPDSAIAAYLAANPQATIAGAVLQLVSVAGLLVFARTSGGGRRAVVAAAVAALAMAASSAASIAAALVAGDAADATVGALRQAGLYAGGVVHVVALGVVVLLVVATLHRQHRIGRAVHVLGLAAGAIACLSVLSVAVYYANALLPLGRLACMVVTVAVGVALWRRRSAGTS